MWKIIGKYVFLFFFAIENETKKMCFGNIKKKYRVYKGAKKMINK